MQVSVSAVVYTRILVSDRIGACPYRPFSTHYYAELAVSSPAVLNTPTHGGMSGPG